MIKIDMNLMKQLRETTQAGMMDCKKALEETNGDIEAAVQWLREKGMAKAAKKVDAVAAEGVAIVKAEKNVAVILEFNCQTDFVAQNNDFIKLASAIQDLIMNNNFYSVEEANEAKMLSGEKVINACNELTGKIGEKITLRRFTKLTKQDNESFGFYQHSNNKIASLLKFSNVAEEAARNIAMHATAMGPKFLDKTKVDQNWLENEKKVLIEQTIAEGKPAQFAEKIVSGRISKLLAEVCLEDQPYVKDQGITVKQYMEQNKIIALDYVRYEVGEGIEKKVSDFAAEVAEQMNAK